MPNHSASTAHQPRRAMSPDALVFSSDDQPGIQRRRRGKHFCYLGQDGRPLREAAELQRIRQLAIPPAYRQVWICPLPNGHLQATGRDARGRKQYRYHPQWRSQRDADKFQHLQAFAQALPRLRRRVTQALARPELSREQLLAAVVHLLDTTLARIGNDAYARDNGSYGLTTLRKRHLSVRGARLHFSFQGKSGVAHRLEVSDRRLARIVRRCQDLPGQTLFCYEDDAGQVRSIGSADVNEHLRALAGEHITAKDFRTWHASVLGLQACREALRHAGRAAQPFGPKQLLAQVAGALGNTPAVCRKSYVHPQVLALAALVASQPLHAADLLRQAEALPPPAGCRGLRQAEQRLLGFLQVATGPALAGARPAQPATICGLNAT